MRILLIRPRRRKQAITLGEFMFSEPLGLECIYMILKESHEVKIVDLMACNEDIVKLCREYKPQVVGITSLCIDVPAVKDTAGLVKSFDDRIVTMVGGTQTFLAARDFCCAEIDHILQYTTLENLHQLLAVIEKKEPGFIDGVLSRVNGFQGTGRPGRNAYLIPDRKSTAEYREKYSYFGYRPCALLQTSRGCGAHCSFCLRWRLEGGAEVDEPLDSVLEQIKDIAEPNIMIIDNDFLHNGERLKEFCRLLEANNLRKNFICYGSAGSIIKNAALLKLFRKNGLQAVLVGYESFHEQELQQYGKKAGIEDNYAAGRILRELGIDCWASFILHPDWNRGDFKKLRKFIGRLAPEISSLVPLTPFPGTPLYRKYSGRLLFDKEDYDRWSFSVVSIYPAQMSLRRYYWEVLKSNLYVNLCLNNIAYMIKKFGFKTLVRIALGSGKFAVKYFQLMMKG
ncbi:MAG: B12-binding domain-containing radical SAM protein [Peptococcaceae bacterium]